METLLKLMINRWIVLLLLTTGPLKAAAQDALSSLQPRERNRLELFAYNYAGYITALNLPTSLSSAKFATAFFVADTVNLTNDFSLHDPANSIPSVYYQLLKQVFISNPLTRGAHIHLSPPDSIAYFRSGDRYFIFWHKQINYRYGRRQTRHFASWEKLSLIDVPNVGFRIYAVSKVRHRLVKAPTLPAHTPEPSAAAPVAVAPTPDLPPAPPPTPVPVTPPPVQTPPPPPPPPVVEDTRRPPSYRFAFSLAGGGLTTVNTGLSNQFGWAAALDLHWYISGWLTVAAGYQHLSLPSATNFTNFHFFYASVGGANYRHSRVILSFEPMGGRAYSDNLIFKNIPAMSYQPFFLWGAKTILQVGLGAGGGSRLLLSAWYLQGNFPAAAGQLPIGSTNQHFSMPTIRIPGILLGWQINIHRPAGWVERSEHYR